MNISCTKSGDVGIFLTSSSDFSTCFLPNDTSLLPAHQSTGCFSNTRQKKLPFQVAWLSLLPGHSDNLSRRSHSTGSHPHTHHDGPNDEEQWEESGTKTNSGYGIQKLRDLKVGKQLSAFDSNQNANTVPRGKRTFWCEKEGGQCSMKQK